MDRTKTTETMVPISITIPSIVIPAEMDEVMTEVTEEVVEEEETEEEMDEEETDDEG